MIMCLSRYCIVHTIIIQIGRYVYQAAAGTLDSPENIEPKSKFPLLTAAAGVGFYLKYCRILRFANQSLKKTQIFNLNCGVLKLGATTHRNAKDMEKHRKNRKMH